MGAFNLIHAKTRDTALKLISALDIGHLEMKNINEIYQTFPAEDFHKLPAGKRSIITRDADSQLKAFLTTLAGDEVVNVIATGCYKTQHTKTNTGTVLTTPWMMTTEDLPFLPCMNFRRNSHWVEIDAGNKIAEGMALFVNIHSKTGPAPISFLLDTINGEFVEMNADLAFWLRRKVVFTESAPIQH